MLAVLASVASYGGVLANSEVHVIKSADRSGNEAVYLGCHGADPGHSLDQSIGGGIGLCHRSEWPVPLYLPVLLASRAPDDEKKN